MNSKILSLLAVLSALFLAGSQYFIWIYAPQEATMGEVQRVFYFHLPLAWWAFVSFLGVFLASIMVLLTSKPKWDLLAATWAEIGVLFSGLALISGSFWARAAWNTWWTWDPRLSTTLIMWFVYMAYLVLRGAGLGEAKKAKVCAVLGIIAFLDVPLVFFSARLWRSIHPAVFASRGGGLEPQMWHTVIVCIVSWGFLFASLTLVRWNVLRMRARVENLLGRRLQNFD